MIGVSMRVTPLLKVLYAVSLRARAAMYLWSRPYLTSVLMSACLLYI